MNDTTFVELLAKAYAIQERMNDAEMERSLIIARIERQEPGAKQDLLNNAVRLTTLKGMALALRIEVEGRAA